MSSLHGKLVGFNKLTGKPVYAAAGYGTRSLSGPDGIGSYTDLSTDFYKTFQPDNWQHAGSQGWTQAPVPGWGENPNLQMFSRRAVDGFEMSGKNIAIGLGLVAFAFFFVKVVDAGAAG